MQNVNNVLTTNLFNCFENTQYFCINYSTNVSNNCLHAATHVGRIRTEI